MSMINAKAYLRGMAKDCGLTEWRDGFDSQNIPENILDKSFWLEISDQATGKKLNQYDQEIIFPISIRIFKKGYRTPADAIDDSVLLIENLIKAVCHPEDALTQGNGIVSVTFDSSRIEPMSASNNNSVMSTLTFSFLVILNV